MSEKAARKRPETAALVVAAALFVLSAVIAIDASRLEITSTYGMGPRAVPFAIAAGLEEGLTGFLGIVDRSAA